MTNMIRSKLQFQAFFGKTVWGSHYTCTVDHDIESLGIRVGLLSGFANALLRAQIANKQSCLSTRCFRLDFLVKFLEGLNLAAY